MREEIILGMLTRVIDDKCLARQGASFNNLCGAWMTASRLYANYEDALTAISRKYRASEHVVERAYRYLRNNNKIDVRGHSVYQHPYKEYTHVKDKYNPPRYYIPGKMSEGYLVRLNGKYVLYDRYGVDVTSRYRNRQLVYRPKYTVNVEDDVVHYFVTNYGNLFSSVKGFDVAVTGTRPCGFNDDSFYSIVDDVADRIPIDSCGGWYLVRNG
jgi:hypothetical protein